MEYIGLYSAQYVADLLGDMRRAIRVCKRPAQPIVGDLDDGQPLVDTPGHMAVPPARIVVGAQNGDVVPRSLLAAQRERVDLGAGMVPRKKVVNGVKDSEGGSHRDLFIGRGRGDGRGRGRL